MADSEKGDVSEKEKQSSQQEEKDKDTASKSSPTPVKSPSGSKAGSARSSKSAASGKKSPEGGKKTPEAGKKTPDAGKKSPKGRTPSPESKPAKNKAFGKPLKARKTKVKDEEKKEEAGAGQEAAEEDALPEGVEPIFLASKTQEIFECQTDIDVTEDAPFKLLKKEDLLADLFNRAAVCDFAPYKQIIQEYPGDEILIGYDAEFKYGQNFFIALSEEAKERLLHPEGEEGEEAEGEGEDVIYKYIPPEPKEWVSQGSEREIQEEGYKETRRRLTVSVRRKRREFGAPVEFTDRNVADAKDGYIECVSYSDKSFDLKRRERSIYTQAVPELVDSSAQTDWKYPRNACTQYEPREFSEEERVQQENNKNLINFIKSAEPRFDLALQQNQIMNVFYDDWMALTDEDSTFGAKADTHLKEYQSFTDLQFSKEKTITCIDWHPTIKGVVAVSAAERMSFDDRVEQAARIIMTPSLILIWSFGDPIHPQLLLEAPDDIYCFKFNPTDPNIIAGGCLNGQVVLWDISAHADKLKTSRSSNKKKHLNTLPGFEDESALDTPIVRYCAVSSIEHSHRGCVTDLQWIPDHMELNRMGVPQENKNLNCVQVMSCAVDHKSRHYSDDGQGSDLLKVDPMLVLPEERSKQEQAWQSRADSVRGCILVWDTRPTKAPHQSRKEKEERNPMGVPTTFKHLDLSWKPMLKVSTFKSEPGGDHSPTKFSIAEKQGDRSVLSQLPDKPEKQESTGGFSFGVSKPGSAGVKRTLQTVNTHFYVGTEDGEIVYLDWMPQKDQDTGKVQTPKPDYYHSLHDGPVSTVQRSPFFNDVILVVGGWTFSLWKEGVTSGPILTSSAASKKLTAGHWSPSRPSVFYIARQDGGVDIWDLLDRTHEPSINQNVSAAPITYLYPFQVTQKQHLLAAADNAGTLHILEIPWSLRQPTPNELNSMANYIDREVKRRAFVVARWDFREQEKRELEAEAKKKAGIAPQVVLTDEEIEYRMKMEYKAYEEEEAQFLRDLGLKEDVEEPLPQTD